MTCGLCSCECNHSTRSCYIHTTRALDARCVLPASLQTARGTMRASITSLALFPAHTEANATAASVSGAKADDIDLFCLLFASGAVQSIDAV